MNRKWPVPTLLSALLAGSLPGAAAAAPETSYRHPADAEITGLEAELIEHETALADGDVAWSTHWRLCWAPAPAAVAYRVASTGAQEVGAPEDTTQRCFAVEVASGISGSPGARPIQPDRVPPSMLSFSVAARRVDGALGPSSAAIPLGRPYPGRER